MGTKSSSRKDKPQGKTVRLVHKCEATRDLYLVTVSEDGHRFTAVPVFKAVHKEDARQMVQAYNLTGYAILEEV